MTEVKKEEEEMERHELKVSLEQADALAQFCDTILELSPGETLLAVLLHQIDKEVNPEKIDSVKAWAHNVISSMIVKSTVRITLIVVVTAMVMVTNRNSSIDWDVNDKV